MLAFQPSKLFFHRPAGTLHNRQLPWQGGGAYISGYASFSTCTISTNAAIYVVLAFLNFLDPSFSAPLERYTLCLSQGGGAYVASGGRADFADCIISDNEIVWSVRLHFESSGAFLQRPAGTLYTLARVLRSQHDYVALPF